MLYVLNAEQHAIWLTEQLSKWHRQSLEVRDRELQLFETNKTAPRALRRRSSTAHENRRRIENQADAERANGRRLTGLVVSGEDLVRQAMRNPEFGVGHLEKWAEMLQILKDISANRMPSVADLLKQAATAPQLAMNAPANQGPTAGQVRAGGGGKPGADRGRAQEAAQRASRRSSTGVVPAAARERPRRTRTTTARASRRRPGSTLPQTTLVGDREGRTEASGIARRGRTGRGGREAAGPAGRVREDRRRAEQRAGQPGREHAGQAAEGRRRGCNTGSPAGSATRWATPSASRRPGSRSAPPKVLDELAEQEAKQSQDVSLIMDDMQAYFERRQYQRFKAVLDEMRKQDVIGGLRQLGDDLKKENGLSIAQCEFWSDTLDRWAEDLVDPTGAATAPAANPGAACRRRSSWKCCRSSKAKINLREETRVAEQAQPALESKDYAAQAGKLCRDPEGTRRPGQDGRRSGSASCPTARPSSPRRSACWARSRASWARRPGSSPVRRPAARPSPRRRRPSSCCCKSRRINPNGGGGGGSTPGGGGTGTTHDSALALIGGGVNEKEVREDHGVSQATGDSGPSLPEEFRSGLDEYFNRLESRPAGR